MMASQPGESLLSTFVIMTGCILLLNLTMEFISIGASVANL